MPSSKSGQGSRSAGPPKAPEPEGRVYFEFVAAGASMRVTAIDERTGAEATIIVPAQLDRASVERVALAKLRYVVDREEFGSH